MITREGNISFMCELVDLIDEFIEDYEAVRGPLDTNLERGLVISYALGAMLCELNCLADTYSDSELFGTLDPKRLFETCAQHSPEMIATYKESTLKRLRDCEWL